MTFEFNQDPYVYLSSDTLDMESAKEHARKSFLKQLGHLRINVPIASDKKSVCSSVVHFRTFTLKDFLREQPLEVKEK